MAKIIGKPRIKLDSHKSLLKMVKFPQGIKWGLKEAIKYQLDKFATKEIQDYGFLLGDKKFMLEMK